MSEVFDLTTKLGRDAARAFGLTVPPEPLTMATRAGEVETGRHGGNPRGPLGKMRGRKRQDVPDPFDHFCKEYGLPVPDHEFPFAEDIGRHWLFDYIFEGWLAIERQGGLWINGRHNRGKALLDEYEKLNHAVLLGYSVLLFSTDELDKPVDKKWGNPYLFIKQVLDGGQP